MAADLPENWYKISESITEINFGTNNLCVINVAGKSVTLALYNSQIFACPQKCPHAGGLLADGYLDSSGNIVCPMHLYRFNLQTGRNVSGEGYLLKTYPVELRNDGVFINIGDRLT